MSERLQQLRAMLIEEPDDTFLRYAIALEQARAGRTTEAIRDLEELVSSVPEHIPSYYQLATLLAEVGRSSDAIAVCDAGALRCTVAGERKAHAELLALKDAIEDQE